MAQIGLSMPSSVKTAFISKNSTMKRDSYNAGINPLWRGYVVTSDHKVTKAYVKQIGNVNELYKEVLCSLLGRAIGIDTPEPLIVKVEANHPDIPNNGEQLFFGTEDCESPSFSRFMVNNKSNEEQLLNYEKLHEIVSFDELIANTDRHPGNILFDGVEYNFIDHGRTFPPDFAYNTPMTQCDWGGNRLAEMVVDYQGHNDVKTKVFMTKVNRFIRSKLSAEQINLLPESCRIDQDSLNIHHKNIQSFLMQRLPILFHLVGFNVVIAENGQLSLMR
ncbi:HipA family kinase [Acinetobacter johnsonii]|uniref:HipA family kinase n=1 Tax=Acinetobacter johnsonii TaxID=40214 RepID=UPI0032B401ED